jgi:ribosome-binding factor A
MIIKKNVHRTDRVAQQIQRYLAKIILFYQGSIPLFKSVTITRVKVAPDLSVARVFFSVFDLSQKDLAAKELQNEAKNLRHMLAHELNLRITPVLQFVHDESISKGEQMDLVIEAAMRGIASTDE